MSDPSSSASEQHAVALRVMRLPRPTFLPNDRPSFWEADDFVGRCLSQPVCGRGLYEPQFPGAPLSRVLLVPQNFGSVYVGETFSCYISVHNSSLTESVSLVQIFMKLEDNNRRTLATRETAPYPGLGPLANCDMQVEERLNEVGDHHLTIKVVYFTAEKRQRELSKSFKFPVQLPFDIRTLSYPSPLTETSDSFLLEATIHSRIGHPVRLEGVALQQPSGVSDEAWLFSVEPVSKDVQSTEDDDTTVLNEGDERSFLYRIQLKPSHGKRPADLRQASLGRLQISWKTAFGDGGLLNTADIKCSYPAPTLGIQVTANRAPSTAKLNQPLDVELNIQNVFTSKSLVIRPKFSNQPEKGIFWTTTKFVPNSPNGDHSVCLAPGKSVPIVGTLMPEKVGVIEVGGLLIWDLEAKRELPFNNICTISVS